MGFTWWVADYWEQSPLLLVSWAFWVIFSIVLHELAHGLTAVRCGDPTPELAGHITWNPIVHMGRPSLLMFALVGIAWGQTPVNPRNFRGTYDDAKVAAAGPAMNLLLALLASVAAGVVVGLRDRGGGALLLFLLIGAEVNFVLLLLNMIPFPPLDGSTVLSRFSRGYRAFVQGPTFRSVAFIVFIVVFVKAGPYLFGAANWLVDAIAGPVARLFGGG